MRAILNALTTHLTANTIPSLQTRTPTVPMAMKPGMLKLVVEMMRLLAMPMKTTMSEVWED